MHADAKLLVRLYDVELEGTWGRGDQIYSEVWLTNDLSGFKDILNPLLAEGAGELEFSQFCDPCVVVYSKLEKASVETSQETLALLHSYLFLIQGFLNVLWVVKDHSVNFELGFLQVYPEHGGPYINSNLIGDAKIFADGGKKMSHFTREEVRTARQLFSSFFSLVCPPKDFKKSNPFFQRQNAFEIASRKDSLKIERFFFFIGAARSQSDLGLKLAVYCTALEALFSTDTSELTHKISERVACFLGRTLEDRVDLYQQVKKAYNIRSKVIHGDTISEQTEEELGKFSVNIDSVLRQIARKVMEVKNLAIIFNDKNSLESFFQMLVFSGPSNDLPEKLALELIEQSRK